MFSVKCSVVELLEQGCDVVAVDNFTNSKPEAIKRVKELAGRDFTFYEMDLRDKSQLDRVFAENDIDCVIHFAGLKAVTESVEMPLTENSRTGGCTNPCPLRRTCLLPMASHKNRHHEHQNQYDENTCAIYIAIAHHEY